jgi:tetratricopeptide (TPR) repeat protein
MNVGKIVFAQIMQFIPRREFNDIVAKYRGNYRVRNLTCHDQLLVMCLAQYADKKSLRDIEASLNALAVTHKLYHCGISYAVPRNTLAKANELRDWHIYAELGQVLIKKVRPLYSKAREAARNSLEFNPNNGKPYILIGKLYAGSNVFDDPVLKKTVYWVAVDKFQKARQVDPSCADEAADLIRRYSPHFPSKDDIFFKPELQEGKSFFVGGWISESTICR